MKQSTIFMLVFLALTLWSLVFTFHAEFILSFASLALALVCWLIGIALERESK
jgi:hypothetical protein